MATFHTSLYASSLSIKKISWLCLARILIQENDKRQGFHTQDSHVVFLGGTTYFFHQENILNIQSFTPCTKIFSLLRKHIK